MMKTVMIASLDHHLADELQKDLEPELKVSRATGEGEIIEAASQGLIDILVLHSRLKTGDSLSVLKRLQQLDRKVFVLFVEVGSRPDLKEEALSSGAYHVITPPLSRREIKILCLKASREQDLYQQVLYLRRELENFKANASASPLPPPGEILPDRSHHYYFQVLRKFSRAITHILDLDKLQYLILDSLKEAFDIAGATLFLRHSETSRFIIGISTWLPSSFQETFRLNLETGLPAWLVKHQQILKKEDLGIKTSIEESLQLGREMEALKASLIVPLFANGKLIGILASANRVTGKRFSEEDLELFSILGSFFAITIENSILLRQVSTEKNHSQSILENMTTGVITVDKNGVITTINMSARKILNQPDETGLGQSIQKLGSRFADLVFRTLKTGEAVEETEVSNPTNKHPLLTSTSFLSDEQGRTQGVILLVQDLFEQKQMETKVRNLERWKFWSELAARMAHEVKNPLVAIRTFAELLPQRYDDLEFREEFSNIVLSEIDRLDGIIEYLLRFAQPATPRMMVQDIHPILEKVSSRFWPEASERGVSLKKQYASTPLLVDCDSELLKEGLEQILKNAIEACNNNGEVILESRFIKGHNKYDYAQIIFSDPGEGITPENMDKIFSPFFSTKTRGIGLGLAVARRIVHDHRGEIQIQARNKKGTEVTVQLPLAALQQSESMPEGKIFKS